MFRYSTAILLLTFYSISNSAALGADDLDSLKRRLFTEKLNEYERFELLLNIADHTSNADTIIFYGVQALDLCVKADLNPAPAMVTIGKGYLYAGKPAVALEYFTDAAAHYKEANNDVGLATVYNFFNRVYSSQQNHENAILYLKKAIEIFKKEKDSIRLSTAQHNLGYEYYQVNQYDSALMLFEQSKNIYQNLGYEQGIAYCIGNSGLVYSKQAKFDKAETHLLEAIERLSTINDEFALADFINIYAHVLQQRGDLNQAKHYALRSYDIAKKYGIKEAIRDAALRLTEIYEEQDLYDSAFHYQSIYYKFRDSIKNLAGIQKMADLRTEFEVSQKQAEVDLLQKRRTIQLIVIGGLLLILILAAWLIYVYYKSLKRTKRFTKALDERRLILEKQGKELQKLNNIKDRFFSIISHDLRSPINSLGGISFMIKESMENDNKALLKEVSDYIDQNVVSLTGLLENLLNWALSQQGHFPFKKEVLDTRELIEEVVRLYSSVLVSKNLKVELDLLDDLYISGDNNSLMMIVRNLISNAYKFTKNGGIIRISSKLIDGSIAEIKVIDNGIGIPKDKLDTLFELNKDKSTRGTDQEKGMGLGLTLVHEFVEKNLGKIQVESSPGKGSSFILNFPAVG